MAFAPYMVGPSLPFAPPGVAVPAAAKTALTDSTNIASLLNARTGTYASARFTFNQLRIQSVGLVVVPACKLYLLETIDGAIYRERGELAIASAAPSATAAGVSSTFPAWTSTNPLIVEEGSEIVIATSVNLTAGQLMAFLEGGRVWGGV